MAVPSSYWTASWVLFIGVVTSSCVFGIPLFPTARHINDAAVIMGTTSYIISSILLGYEARRVLLFRWQSIRTFFNCQGFDLLADPPLPDRNYLAFFFFIGYLTTHAWKLTNEIYFGVYVPACYSWNGLINHLSKLVLAALLMIAIIYKDSSNRNSAWSAIRWSTLCAVCIVSTCKYVVEEVVMGYIELNEIVEQDRSYKVNITSPYINENELPEIFNHTAECLKKSAFLDFKYFLEMFPFSAEYFSLAAFFCADIWKNIAAENVAMPPPRSLPNPNPHRCNRMSCYTVFQKRTAVVISVTTLICTAAILIWFTFKLKSCNDYQTGIWVVTSMRFGFQFVLFVTELLFQVWHMKGMDHQMCNPSHYQLDSAMLVFPLFFLAILLTLQVFPDLIQLNDVPWNRGPYEALFVAINLLKSAFTWIQLAFQATFLSQVFCRIRFGGLYEARFIFMVLASLNLCMWFCWTWEFKFSILHSRFLPLYGVGVWISVGYSTNPFVLFCLAHTVVCFWNLIHQIKPPPPELLPQPPVPNLRINMTAVIVRRRRLTE